MPKSQYSFLPTDPVYNIYRYEGVSQGLQRFKILNYQDIVKSEIIYKSLDPTTLNLEILELDLIDDIFENENKQIMLERIYYTDNEIDDNYDKTGKYNQYFFVNGATITFTQSDNQQTRTISLQCFEFQTFFMTRMLHDQTRGYSNPISGEYPDDFDTITYPNGAFFENVPADMNYIVDFVYRRYVFKTARPSKKGTPTGQISYGDNLFLTDNYVFNDENYSFDYYTTQDKKSVFDFFSQLFSTAFDNDLSNIYRPFLKFTQNSNLLSVCVNGNKNININNIISRDFPTLISKKIENIGILRNSLFAQQTGDNFESKEAEVYINPGIDEWFISKYWDLEVGENESNTDNLDTALKKISSEQVEANKITSDLEIEFNDLKFITDFFVNDTLTLVNFNKYIDGTYQIRQITEIIENEYVTYSIDEMVEITS